ncbi:MAG: hypothetical protein JRH18_19900 [Deltaproteobacteria bacterium]|nr:hypothetical protein [Deltaproteobacteria bacterium]MBW1962109.1 hypothetical protein [Deltaproteobacteria bacterium]MBW2153916.1 hypothetical protein [Deltaproteobacteria bacterium]
MKFIGIFVHLTNQEQPSEENRRHGEFVLMVDAESPEQALRMFRDRIVEFRENSQFFDGLCKIFLLQLFEFDDFPKARAMMLNYKSIAGDPLMPFINCVAPSDQEDWCSIHDWRNNWPNVDGQLEKLFLEFKAQLPGPDMDAPR